MSARTSLLRTPGQRRILVTGASGFLGHRLCQRLRSRGDSVCRVVRSATEPLDGDSVAVSDITDASQLRKALEGVDVVVHLAARVHRMSENGADPLALYRKVNVEGTRVLLEESIAAGVKAFIFASSVKAVGEMSRHPWTEATASPVPQDPYGISKLEAEQLILARVRGGDMHAPSLRFPMMYGPEMKGNLLRLMSWINRGLPVPVGSSATRRSFLYVDNAVAAIEALIDTPLCLQAPFFASDGQDLSTVELVTLIAAALGKAPRVLRLPAIATRLSLAEATGRFVPFGRNINSAMHRLTDSLQVDPAALRNAVGYAPTVSVERGIGATAEWFQSTQQDR